MSIRISGAAGALMLAVALAPPATASVQQPAGPTCDGRQATIVGTPRADRLVGTTGDDVIVALAGEDQVDGRGGADLICGGPGIDRLHGGGGDDRILGQGDGIQNDGSAYYGGDYLSGGAGDDVMVGGGTRGEDILRFPGARRGIVLDLADGTAVGQGNDVLRGITHASLTHYDDEVRGLKQASRVSTGAGDDLMTEAATVGWDGLLTTGPGRDVVDAGGRGGISLGRGADTVDAHGSLTVYGYEGDDTIRLHRTRVGFTVHPGDGDDVVTGSPGPDTVYSTPGDDTLVGRGGDDLLIGGVGVDSADGGAGTDRCLTEIRVACETASAR